MGTKFLQHGIGALGFFLDLLFTNLDKSYLFVIDYVLVIFRLMLEQYIRNQIPRDHKNIRIRTPCLEYERKSHK